MFFKLKEDESLVFCMAAYHRCYYTRYSQTKCTKYCIGFEQT